MTEIETSGDRGRQFVTALARGLEVLRAYRPGEIALGNQEIAQRTGLPKPTVTRLTYTLCELGYLVHLPRHGGYQLGPAVLGLGYTMLSGLEVRDRARPLIRTLADKVDCAVALGMRDRMNLVYVECARGCGRITLSLDVGSRIPLAKTAMGRAVFVGMAREEREAVLAELKEREADDYAGLAEGLQRAVEDFEALGFVCSFGDWQREVHAVGVPLTLPGEEQSYALNAGGPAFLKDPQHMRDVVGPELVQLARLLSSVPMASVPMTSLPMEQAS
ncbi:MAG: IclR family transcriptional regulator [Kiloniellales bacterium]